MIVTTKSIGRIRHDNLAEIGAAYLIELLSADQAGYPILKKQAKLHR